MTILEFLQRKAVKSIFDWLPNEGDGAQNDRMMRHLQRHTRAFGNRDINDLYHKESIWSPELIKYLVAKRIQRYDLS